MIRLTINEKNRPLKHAYVSHFDFFRIPQEMIFMTDDAGKVTIINAGANTPSPTGPAGPTKVRVFCQNPVLRMLDGGLGIEVSQEFDVNDNDTINITTAARQVDHYSILNQAWDAYDTVWRQFAPFSAAARGQFPFGRKTTLAQTRGQLPRIEARYPENQLLAPGMSWTEPTAAATGYPLLHLADKARDSRVFGTNGQAASLIPHELSHAMHFAEVPPQFKAAVEAAYVGFIVGTLNSPNHGGHSFTVASDPLVAYLEAVGAFGERFFFFAKATPSLSGQALRQAFFRDELTATPAATAATQQGPVARLNGNVVQPLFTGKDVEAAVYGALFVDMARRIGLKEVVNAVVRSARDNIFTFADFRLWLIAKKPQHTAAIDQVKATWGM